MLSCSFYLHRFRKYVSYGFPIINFCNPGVHYETPCISKLKSTLKKYRLVWDIYPNNRRIFMTDRLNDIIRKHFSWKYVLFTYFRRLSALLLILCNMRDRNLVT